MHQQYTAHKIENTVAEGKYGKTQDMIARQANCIYTDADMPVKSTFQSFKLNCFI